MPWIGQGVSIGIVGELRCPSGGNSDGPALGANVTVTVLCGDADWVLTRADGDLCGKGIVREVFGEVEHYPLE
jgi:hypothetical protein